MDSSNVQSDSETKQPQEYAIIIIITITTMVISL